jgi:hypothetical protein
MSDGDLLVLIPGDCADELAGGLLRSFFRMSDRDVDTESRLVDFVNRGELFDLAGKEPGRQDRARGALDQGLDRLLSYTALDNAANEAMPVDFSITDAGGAIPVAA